MKLKIFCLICISVSISYFLTYQAVAENRKVYEYKIPESATISGEVLIDQDFKLSYRLFDGKKYMITYKENEGDWYPYADNLKLNLKGSEYAYRVRTNGEWHVIKDGKKSKPYSHVYWLRFSPDYSRFTYITKDENDKRMAIIDGKEEQKYVSVSASIFSPDSSKIAYTVSYIRPPAVGKNSCMVYNGTEGKRYRYIDGLWTFSPDSSKLAYVVNDEGKYFVVINRKEGKKYDYIFRGRPILFSSDSSHFAYTAGDTEKRFVVCDNIELNKVDHVQSRSLIFSSDNSKLAYICTEDGKRTKLGYHTEGKWFVSVYDLKNGTIMESKRYGYVKSLSFNKSDILFVAEKEGEWLGTEQRKYYFGKSQFVVFGNKEMKKYTWIKDIYSSNNSAFCYIAGNESEYIDTTYTGKQFIVFNNKEGKSYDIIDKVYFSPDGSKLCFVAKEGGYWQKYNYNGGYKIVYDSLSNSFLVMNKSEGERYKRILKVVFSPDSKHCAYVARYSGYHVIVDNSEETIDFNERPIEVRFSTNSKTLCCVGIRQRMDDKKVIKIIKTLEDKRMPSDNWIRKYANLENKSLEELRYLRNEIYARHGYLFMSEDLIEYFNNKTWYRPKPGFSEDELTEKEKELINRIKDIEKKKSKDINDKEMITTKIVDGRGIDTVHYDICLKALKQKDPIKKGRAVTLLGNSADKKYTYALLNLLNERVEEIEGFYEGLCYSIANIGDIRAIPVLLDEIKNKKLTNSQLDTVIYALGTISKKSMSGFRYDKKVHGDKIESSPKKTLKTSALNKKEEILIKKTIEKAAVVVNNLLEKEIEKDSLTNTEWSKIHKILEALGKMKSKSSLPVIKKLLKDKKVIKSSFTEYLIIYTMEEITGEKLFEEYGYPEGGGKGYQEITPE